MKKLIISLAILTACFTLSAQNYTRSGNEYTAVSSERSQFEDTKTGYTWKDKQGNVYDIYITKRNACYIWKTSKKTGNQYKYYLPKEVAAEIAKELGRSND